jgi:hypothetical protein
MREQEIEAIFARAGKKIITRRLSDDDAKWAYMIAEKGVVYLRTKYGSSGIRTLVIDGTKPWHDRYSTLPKIASGLSGRICVVDKYYGRGTLALLNHFRHGAPLQFLTGRTNESPAAFARELRDFQKEVPALEVRLFPAHSELHDRYIISRNALVIVGHGIKDIGTKESFLVVLEGEPSAELRGTLLRKFDERWAASLPVA